MKKLVAAFLVSGLVMTGVGVNHAEALAVIQFKQFNN